MNYSTMSAQDFINMKGIDAAKNILSLQKPHSDYFYIVDENNEYRVSFALLRNHVAKTVWL